MGEQEINNSQILKYYGGSFLLKFLSIEAADVLLSQASNTSMWLSESTGYFQFCDF